MTQYKPQVDLVHRELSLMLPRFYDDAPEADGILYADAVEVERVRADARELLAQFTAVTATWGLSDWERVLDLAPRPNSSAELRRARILAKLRGTAPATLANMLAMINAHVPNNDANLVELPTAGTITVEVPLQNSVDFGAMYSDIHTYKPAHLWFDVHAILGDTVSLIGSDYSFDVPWLICNCFTTADALGLGVFANIDTQLSDYNFDVLYPITNAFTTDEAKGLGVIASPTSFDSEEYTAINEMLVCGDFDAEEAY